MPRHENIYECDFDDMKGWLKVDRGLLTFIQKGKELTILEAVCDLLYKVTQKGGKTKRGINLKENQAIVSMAGLARRWKWNRKRVERLTNLLHEKEVVFKYVKGHQGNRFVLFSMSRDNDHEQGMVNNHDKRLNNKELSRTQVQEGSCENVQEQGHITISTKISKKEDENSSDLNGKKPSFEMALEAADYIRGQIILEHIPKIAEKTEKLGDLDLSLNKFRDYYVTLDGKFFRKGNVASQEALLAVFNEWINLETAKLPPEPEAEEVKGCYEMMSEYFEKKFNQKIQRNENKALASIKSFIRQKIEQEKKSKGYPNWKASENEKLEKFKWFLDNLPEFYLNQVSIKLLASNMNSIWTKIENNQSPKVKFNLPDIIEMNTLEKWHEFKDRIIDMKTYQFFIDYEGSRAKRVACYKAFKQRFEQISLEEQVKILKTA